MTTDFNLRPTLGLDPGMTIQFAEGHWTGRSKDEIGAGVAIDDAAFDSVMPIVLPTCPGWNPMHRYGVYSLGTEACCALAEALRCEGDRLREVAGEPLGKAELFHRLADWLDVRCKAKQKLSILGF